MARNSIEKTLSSLEGILSKTAELQTLSMIDDIKKWVSNHRDTKKRKFLEDLYDEAKKIKFATWRTWAHVARVMRYAGRYRKAQLAYIESTDMIDRFRNPTDEQIDVYADFAEFFVYLGYPARAVSYINRKIAAPIGWHLWVKAFAQHQNAFATAFPFGTATREEPGAAGAYRSSNRTLDDALADPHLPRSEQRDLELIKVANFGALARLGVGPAQDAIDALGRFHGSGSDPVNQAWSIIKEDRGRFCLTYHPKIDTTGTPSAVKAWRKAYRMHYVLNLYPYIPMTSGSLDPDLKDGENLEPEEFGDDEKN
jgi:hypothetical protein